MYRVFINIVSISFAISFSILLFKLLSPVLQKITSAKIKQFIWIMLALRLAVPFAFTNLNYEIVTINEAGAERMLMDFESEAYADLYIDKESDFSVYSRSPLSYKIIKSTEDNKTGSLYKLIDKFVNWYRYNEEPITTVYFIGVGMFLFLHLLTYFFLKCKLDLYSREVFSEVDKTILAFLTDEIGVSQVPDVYFSSVIRGPMVVGVLQPAIYIPDVEYTEEELKSVFRHELIHIKHKDLWLKKLYLLVNAIHWFNPFCYLMTSAAGKDMELYCDEQVVKKYSLEERVQYNHILLKFAELSVKRNYGEKYFSTDYLGRTTELKKRFRNNIYMGHKGFGIPVIIIAMLSCLLTSEYVVAQVRTNKDIFCITEYEPLMDYYYKIFTAEEIDERDIVIISEAPVIKIYCDDDEIEEYQCELNYEKSRGIITNVADEFFEEQVKKELPLFKLRGKSDICNIKISFLNGQLPEKVVIEDMVLDEKGYIQYYQGDKFSQLRDADIVTEGKFISFNIGNHEAIPQYDDSVDYFNKLTGPVFRGFYVTCYWNQYDGAEVVRYKFVIRTEDSSYDYLLQ